MGTHWVQVETGTWVPIGYREKQVHGYPLGVGRGHSWVHRGNKRVCLYVWCFVYCFPVLQLLQSLQAEFDEGFRSWSLVFAHFVDLHMKTTLTSKVILTYWPTKITVVT